MTQRHALLVFIDGIGLGEDDPGLNPFVAAALPILTGFTGGHKWVRGLATQLNAQSAFIPTDARMGVPGRPQSATGQATIITGRNVPEIIGEHYGPRPNEAIRAVIRQGSLFSDVTAMGQPAALLEAYPPPWHDAVNRGKRLLASYQFAARDAGLPLYDHAALVRGDAMTMEWTGESWHSYFKLADTPIYTPDAAGQKMVELAQRHTFSMFAHWHTDTLGHRGTVAEGAELLGLIDQVIAGALPVWDYENGLLVLTSDHGNLEDLSHGKHTENNVPTLLIGAQAAALAPTIHTLADIAPAIRLFLGMPA